MERPQRNRGPPFETADAALRLILLKINDWVWERLPVSLTILIHPDRPRYVVWVKGWNV
jgi:hypothetical protein